MFCRFFFVLFWKLEAREIFSIALWWIDCFLGKSFFHWKRRRGFYLFIKATFPHKISWSWLNPSSQPKMRFNEQHHTPDSWRKVCLHSNFSIESNSTQGVTTSSLCIAEIGIFTTWVRFNWTRRDRTKWSRNSSIASKKRTQINLHLNLDAMIWA